MLMLVVPYDPSINDHISNDTSAPIIVNTHTYILPTIDQGALVIF